MANDPTGHLIAQIQADPGNQDLWREFFARFTYLARIQIRLYAMDLAQEHADDILQEASLKIIARMPKLQNREGLQTYIQKTVRSVIHDFRKTLQERADGIDGDPELIRNVKNRFEHARLVELWTDFSKLFPTKKEREIVRRVWNEETIEQIRKAVYTESEGQTKFFTEYEIKKVRARLTRLLTEADADKVHSSAK